MLAPLVLFADVASLSNERLCIMVVTGTGCPSIGIKTKSLVRGNLLKELKLGLLNCFKGSFCVTNGDVAFEF